MCNIYIYKYIKLLELFYIFTCESVIVILCELLSERTYIVVHWNDWYHCHGARVLYVLMGMAFPSWLWYLQVLLCPLLCPSKPSIPVSEPETPLITLP